MIFTPKVSIVIPVYNGAKYLREAIDSALEQTYKNTEIIVVNDGSNDGGKTEEAALSYGNKIRYFRKQNGGVATALNLGIKEMTGEYFSWLSHDDVYFPHKLQTQINYLCESQDKTLILYSDFVYINDKSQVVFEDRIINLEPDEFRLALITGFPIHGCTSLIPRLCFEKVGLFDEALRTTQDYDLWFKMAGEFKFIHTQDILIKSRIHPEQGSRTITSHITECNKVYINCLKEISAEPTKYPREFLPSFFCKAAINLFNRKFHEAARYSYQLALNNINEQNRYRACIQKAISMSKTGDKTPKILCLGDFVFDGELEGDIISLDIEDSGKLENLQENSFDIVVSHSALSKIPDYRTLIEKITRTIKPGGILYIDYEIPTQYWGNTETYNLYLRDLESTFEKDYLFNFSIGESSALKRYLRLVLEVISIRDWRKLVTGVLKRIMSTLRLKKKSVELYNPEKDSVQWDKAVQQLSGGYEILLQRNYLACREAKNPAEIWNRWNSKITDTCCLIAQKRI